MAATAGTGHTGLPPLSRDGRPEILDDSLGGSLRVPVSKGARLVTVMLVVILDVAMAVIGIVLLTRSSGSSTPKSTPALDAGLTIGSGAPPAVDAGEIVTGDGVRIGGDTKIKTQPRPRTGPGPGPGPRPAPDAATGPGPGPAPDAAPAPAPAPDADADAAPAPAPAPDAGTGTGTGTGGPADAGPDDPNADSIPDQVAIHLSRSQSRLSRCYTQATKPLPEDQPLEGEVDIAFEVMPTGGTRNVSVARNTTGSNTLATCISGIVGEWTFTPFDGASVDVIRTFRFRPAG